MKMIFAALVIVVMSVQGQAAEDVPAGDAAALQGRWKAWLSPEQCMAFEVRGKSFTLAHQTGDKSAEPWNGTLVFDERASPKRMTWTRVQVGGRDLPDNQCIYELHGDTWLLIGGGGAAPEHFYSGGGQGSQTLVFKREAKK
jgi:uncharacterized protein (TIGR03067 family)